MAQGEVQFYRVERGITQLIRQTVDYEVPTTEFAKFLATPRDNDIHFLPSQCRSIFAEGASGRVTFVIEQPPTIRHCTWPARARRPEGKTEFDIAIPWCYMIFTAVRTDPENPNSTLRYQGMSIYASKKRIMTLDDKFTGMPINNVEQNGRICFGTAAVPMGANLGEHIDSLAISFWNSNFNYDHTPVLPGYKDYAAWEKDTAKDPACWLNWPWDDQTKWRHPEFTLRDVVAITDDRKSPAMALDPIPTLPQAPTFGRAAEWVATLDQRQRDVLKAALAQ